MSTPPYDNQQASVASPIADRTYRNYDGPTRTRALRWWIISLSVIRSVLRKPAFWMLGAICIIPYLMSGFQLYTSSVIPAMLATGGGEAQKYRWQFFSALQNQEFWIFLTALVVGTDCIAGDLRANALQIYLSKPITKSDYLTGKWVGVFLPLYLIAAAPALVLFLCAAFGMFGEFWKTDPTLIWRMLGAVSIPAIVHASLLVGFSAWSKSGRIAGAVYAGVCLFSAILAGIIGGVQLRSHTLSPVLVQHLSISGAINGLAQAVYNVNQQEGFGIAGVPKELTMMPHGFLWEMSALCACLIVAGVAMARLRINAVEVVRG